MTSTLRSKAAALAGLSFLMLLTYCGALSVRADTTGSTPPEKVKARASVHSQVRATSFAATPSQFQLMSSQEDAPDQGSAASGAALTDAQKRALIKETQNPVGNIAILPFQNNWNYAAGPTKTTIWNMNIQPVVPIMLSQKANLVERVITPVINVTPLLPQSDCDTLGLGNVAPCGAQLGIGNIQLQSFYAPKTNPNGFIWGAGPIFSFPTVTKNLGSQQFGGGVNAVGLVMPGSWVMGMLVTQRWYIAGPSAPPRATINDFFAQPFVNFNFGKGWALTEAPGITANWNEPGDRKWTVPLGLQISNTNTWLQLPMTYSLAYYGNVVRPPDAPYGLIRFNWALLWPVKRGRPSP